jgi:hypothetical protein
MSAIAMYLGRLKFALLAVFALSLSACDVLDFSDNAPNDNLPNENLKVVIIRHAEKAKDGDNLSCQGQNRALQLASVLHQKINKPDFTYVPALKLDKATKHSRMFQTVTPFAVKYDLTINSKYATDDYDALAKSVLKKEGTVLMVWSHSEIANLAKALGVDNVPEWLDSDFDSIWEISYNKGKANLRVDQQGLNPANACIF